MNESQLPRLRFGPHASNVSLNNNQRVLLQSLFEDCREVLIENEFEQGHSSTRVLLVTPSREEVLAPQVVKFGSLSLVESEQVRHKQLIAETIPLLASQINRMKTYQGLGAIALTYMGGAALGADTVSLAAYYRQHSIKKIQDVLSYLLLDVLGKRWYAKRSSSSTKKFFQDFYGKRFPGNLILKLDEISSEPLLTKPEYRYFSPETPDGVYSSLKTGNQIHVDGFQVEKQRPDRIDLIHPNYQTRLWINVDPDKDFLPVFKINQKVYLQGVVIDSQKAYLTRLVQRVFSDEDEIQFEPKEGLVYLLGMAYPDPLHLYTTYLEKELPFNVSTIHGDLHANNILVDRFGKAWLIDFGQAKKGHTLFDFVQLETHLRHIALGQASLSLADRVNFELHLACSFVDPEWPLPSFDQPKLAKVFSVIQHIRNCAVHFLGPTNDLYDEYFPALFLYLLSAIRYFKYNGRDSTQHMFIAAMVLGALLEQKLDCQLPTTAPILDTPAIEQFHFFLKKAEGDSSERQSARHNKFLSHLQFAADTLTNTLGIPSASIIWQNTEKAGRHDMRERYYDRWQDKDRQVYVTLLAYELHDTYLLRLMVYQEGIGLPIETPARLLEQFAITFDEDAPEWLGQSIFITGLSKSVPQEVAESIFQTNQLYKTSLICGELYAPKPLEDMYLLVCATKEQDELATDFFNIFALQLSWCDHKVRRQFSDYETYYHQKVEETERSLSSTLREAEQTHKDLVSGVKDFDTIQTLHTQISQLELDINQLATQVTDVKKFTHAVRINLDSYARVIETYQTLLKPEPDNIFSQRERELSLLFNQMKSDLEFPERELEQAKNTLEILYPVAGRFALDNYNPIRLAQAIQNQARMNSSDFALVKNLTIMFDDIKDSTAYIDKYGDHQWHNLVQRHHEIVIPIIKNHRGQIVKTLGDGSLSIFSNTVAAMQAALEIQQTLQISNQRIPAYLQLHIRLGVHTGSALLSETDVLGLAVSVASRVCSQANAGEIVISETTYKQAGHLVLDFEIIEERKLKGVETPINLYLKKI